MMAQPEESRYANELLSWPGFESARGIAKTLEENPDLKGSLESKLPGLSGRLEHLLDILRELESVPPHTIPVQGLELTHGHLNTLGQHLTSSIANPENAPHVEASANGALVAVMPLLGVIRDKDTAGALEDVRSKAQAVLHGVRTAAGKVSSTLEETTTELNKQHEELKQSLQAEWEQTKQGLVEEAAQMRSRNEASLTEARTNADAHMNAMRAEVDGIRQRADEAYSQTTASFESDRQQIANSRAELAANFDAQIRTWSEAVTETRGTIESEVDGLRQQLDSVVEWAEGIRGDIQIAALAAGFDESQKRYATRARWALFVASLLAVITIGVTLVLFSWLWEVPLEASNSEIARHVGFRLGAISLPLVAGLFSARIYRTFSHLEAVNGERAQAAKAFEGFAARASNDESKDAMLVVLAQLVFAGRDTGHHTEENIMPINVAELVKQIGIRR